MSYTNIFTKTVINAIYLITICNFMCKNNYGLKMLRNDKYSNQNYS